MTNHQSPAHITKTITPGNPPPCLQPDCGTCRGCFGWPAMYHEAALRGDPGWLGVAISCAVTGLTVIVTKENGGGKKQKEADPDKEGQPKSETAPTPIG